MYDNWISVFESKTAYEADLVRNRLDDAGIQAVVLTQHDRSFNLTLGKKASNRVLVPGERVDEARSLLAADPLSDEELTRAALSTDPEDPAEGGSTE
jgi:hypothetical protein